MIFEKNDRLAGCLLCAIAFMAVGLNSWAINAGVYARVATYCGIAREINTFISACVYLGMVWFARRRPGIFHPKAVLLVCLGSCATSLLVEMMALRFEDPLFTVVGLAFGDISGTTASMLLCFALCTLSFKSGVIAATGGMAVGEIVEGFIPMPCPDAAVLYSSMALLLILACCYHLVLPALSNISHGHPVSDLEISNPDSFLRPLHTLFVCTLVYSVARGYALTLNEVEHAPLPATATGIVLLLVGLFMVVSKDRGSTDSLFSLSVLMVVLGLVAVPVGLPGDMSSANVFLRVGYDAFGLLMWLVFMAVGQRNAFALVPLFGTVRCVMALGTIAGAVAGHTSNNLAGTDVHAVTVIALAGLVVFVSVLWLWFRQFSFADAIDDVVHMEKLHVGESGALTAQNELAFACNSLSKQFGLTERESEIFELLAKGRNGRFVIERFVISRNTAKTHIKHIYAKLGVHSQQELIDVVEERRACLAAD